MSSYFVNMELSDASDPHEEVLLERDVADMTNEELLDRLSDSAHRIAYLENQNHFLRLKLKLTIQHCLDNVRAFL